MQNIHSDNYRTLWKEIKALNKGKNIPCSWIRRLNFVETATLPKLINRLNVIPIRIPADFIAQVGKLILKFISSCKQPKIAKTILKKKNKVGLPLLDFKTHYKAAILKTVCDWHEETNRWME